MSDSAVKSTSSLKVLQPSDPEVYSASSYFSSSAFGISESRIIAVTLSQKCFLRRPVGNQDEFDEFMRLKKTPPTAALVCISYGSGRHQTRCWGSGTEPLETVHQRLVLVVPPTQSHLVVDIF